MARYQIPEKLHVETETNVGRVAHTFDEGDLTVPDAGDKQDRGLASLLEHAVTLGLAKALPDEPAKKGAR